jgi:K+ transporter
VGGIAEQPDVLRALAPWHAAAFIADKGGIGLIVLASLFLVVTGGEALYADMGHFGSRPFSVMSQNAQSPSSYFRIPAARAWSSSGRRWSCSGTEGHQAPGGERVLV